MRIFVAIFPPPEIQKSLLRAAQDTLVDGDLRWVQQENIHLTLKFLGHIVEESLEGIRAAIGEVAGCHGPLRIGSSGIGGFPTNGRARVLWAGVKEGSDSLSALAADVDESLNPLGFGRDENSYIPHATLARARKHPVRLPEKSPAKQEIRPPKFTARRFYLVESFLGPGGVTYEKLEDYPLSGTS